MRFSLEDASPLVEFEDPVHLTFEALAEVPDFRKPRGRQHDLKGVLALIVAGLASGHHSFAAIAAFGRRREDDLIPRLGLPRAPSHKTVCLGKARMGGGRRGGIPPTEADPAPRRVCWSKVGAVRSAS